MTQSQRLQNKLKFNAMAIYAQLDSKTKTEKHTLK